MRLLKVVGCMLQHLLHTLALNSGLKGFRADVSVMKVISSVRTVRIQITYGMTLGRTSPTLRAEGASCSLNPPSSRLHSTALLSLCVRFPDKYAEHGCVIAASRIYTCMQRGMKDNLVLRTFVIIMVAMGCKAS